MKTVLILSDNSSIGVNLPQMLQRHQGYDITVFAGEEDLSRQLPGIRFLQGNLQDNDTLLRLLSPNWDFIIDLSTQYPADMQRITAHVQSAGRYIFISSCLVYKPESPNLLLRREEAETRECTEEEALSTDVFTCGPRKAECERILMQSGLPYLILRPFMTYGSHDQTDLLYYWLYQIRSGGLLMIPDQGERLFSATYVKDLAETIILALDRPLPHQVYNVISSPMLSIRKIIDAASPILNQHCMMLNAPPAFLHTQGARQWTEIPLWIDGDHCTYNANRWKQDFGLQPTDFTTGLLETLGYYADRNWPVPTSGLSPEKLGKLLNSLRQAMV